jgi:hypothetical protein
MGRKTTVEKLWHQISELKVLLNLNPRVPVQECRAIIENMEENVKVLRRRELRK